MIDDEGSFIVDVDKALRYPALVRAGDCDIRRLMCKPSSSKKATIRPKNNPEDRIPSDLAQLLLDRSALKDRNACDQSRVLLCLHRSVWIRHSTRLARDYDRLHQDLIQVTLPTVLGLYADHLEVGKDGAEAVAKLKASEDKDIQKMALEDLYLVASRNQKIENLFLTKMYQLSKQGRCRNPAQLREDLSSEMRDQLSSRLHEVQVCQYEIMKNLRYLRDREVAIESSLPWLPKSVEGTDAWNIHKNAMLNRRGHPGAELPKVMKRKWSNHLLDRSEACFSQKTGSGPQEARTSLAPSDHVRKPKGGFKLFPCSPTIPAPLPLQSRCNSLQSQEGSVQRRDSLDRWCHGCGNRLSVKFIWEGLETESLSGKGHEDQTTWIRFTCKTCSDPVKEDPDWIHGTAPRSKDKNADPSQGAADSEGSRRGSTASSLNLDQVLKDISLYYTKKLDILRVKLEQHYLSKPKALHRELVSSLMEAYKGEIRFDELWQDMFCRILDLAPSQRTAVAKPVQQWMQEEDRIRMGIRACVADLEREKAEVAKFASRTDVALKQRQDSQREVSVKLRDQREKCHTLHQILDSLRSEREAREEESRRASLEQEAAEKEARTRRMAREDSRRRKLRTEIQRRHTARQTAQMRYKAELLHEIQAKVNAGKEKALKNLIRVNIRKSMSDQRNLMREEASKEAANEELHRQARLETLRKVARRRIGLGVVMGSEDEGESTAMNQTVASAAKQRTANETAWPPRPAFLHTYDSDNILGDIRVMVEHILREKGLLASGRGAAVQTVLKELQPPTVPRRDTRSDQVAEALKPAGDVAGRTMTGLPE